MTIIERARVLAAYERERALGADHDRACAIVARALGLPAEAVHDAVTEDTEDA